MRYLEIFSEAIDELVAERVARGCGVDATCDEVSTADHPKIMLMSRRFQMKISLMSRVHCVDNLGLFSRRMMLSRF